MKLKWFLFSIQIVVFWFCAETVVSSSDENNGRLQVNALAGEGLVLTLEDPQFRVWRIERSTDLERWTAIQLLRSEQDTAGNRVNVNLQPGSGFFRATVEAPPPSSIRFAEICLLSRESETIARLKVLREGDRQLTEQVHFATNEINATAGSDYVERIGILEFAPGVSEQFIEIQLLPDTSAEEDELLLVTLSPSANQEELWDASLVAILDDDTPVHTTAACLEFIPEQFSFSPRPLRMLQDQGVLYWSEAGEFPLRSMATTGTVAVPLAQKMGVLQSLVVRDGMIYRMESRDGAGESGCVGFDSHRALVRTRIDGSEPNVLADYDSCAGAPSDLIVDPHYAFVVSSTVSPPHYEILRVPLNGNDPEVLVSTTGWIKSIASDGAMVYWAEETDSEMGFRTNLHRISRHGGTSEMIAEGYIETVGNLSVNNGILYTMTTSLNGAKLVAIDLTSQQESTLWETPAGTPIQRASKLVVQGSYAYWLDEQSLNRLSLNGGPEELLAGILPFPGDLWVEGQAVYWSETERSGRIMRLDLDDPSKGPIQVTEARFPEALAIAKGILYWIEAGPFADTSGFGRIAAKTLSDNASPVWTALAGISEDTAPFVLSGDYLYIADRWTIRRVPRQGGNAEMVSLGFFTITTLAVDSEYVYWVDSDPMNIVRKAPLAGGEPIFLGVGTGGPFPHSLQQAGANLYWIDHDTRIVSLPKTGGAPTVLVDEGDFISNMVIQGNRFYYAMVSTGLLKRLSLTGGTAELFATSEASIWTRLMATPTHLFRLHQVGLDRINLETGATQILLSQDMEQDLFFAGAVWGGQNQAYWTETLTGKIKTLNF